MRVWIVSASESGFPVIAAKAIQEDPEIELVGLIYARNISNNRKKLLGQKLKKTLKIGILGAINGVRLRKWFAKHKQFLSSTTIMEGYANANQIPYLEVGHTARPTSAEIERIESLNADLGLSLGNSYIASKLFNLPGHGMLNIHHEILPEYKGAQSIIWQLYNGNAVTGYSVHEITKKIDDGKIVFRQKIPIKFESSFKDTVAKNYAFLKEHSAHQLPAIIKEYLHGSSIVTTIDKVYKSYTTPTFKQFLTMKRNFKKLSRRI